MGLVLIIWAAFALTITTIVAGFLEPFISDANSSQYTIQQAKDFLPYVLMFGFVFTFLFGGVGTNAVSSALMEKSSILNNEEINKMQTQLNNISNKVDSLEKFHWKYFILSIVIFIIYLVGSAIAFR